MASECAESLPIQRVPHVGLRVFGAGEEQVALPAVLDLGDGTLMAMQH